MKEIVKAYTDGANGLVFTYGVTNAGKTFTVQGTYYYYPPWQQNFKNLESAITLVCNKKDLLVSTGCPKDGGILPRSLDMIFSHVRGRLYPKMNLKPCFSSLTKRLDDMQVKQEEAMKTALLASLKEVKNGKHSSLFGCGVGMYSNSLQGWAC